MRYRLRTLLIVMAVAPPVLAGIWLALMWNSEEPERLILYWYLPLFLIAGFVIYNVVAISLGYAALWMFNATIDLLLRQRRR
jgi:hypothetical protein